MTPELTSEQAAFLRDFLTKLIEGRVCPRCNTPIKQKYQVGCCVYSHPFMRCLGPILWLTDLAEPTPDDVGLTSTSLSCDRLAHRFKVTTSAAVPWKQVRSKAPLDVVEGLEAFGQPDHWWIVRRPLTSSEFLLDDTYHRNP